MQILMLFMIAAAPPQASTSGIIVRERAAATQDETNFATSCAGHRLTAIYGNVASEKAARTGVVRSLKLDGLEIPGAAEALTRRASNRDIEQILFTNCGLVEGKFRVRGTVRFGEAASTRTSLAITDYFEADRQGLEMD